jgi:hypothetical protein
MPNDVDELIAELNKEPETSGDSLGDNFEPAGKTIELKPEPGTPAEGQPATPPVSRADIERMAASWIDKADVFQRMCFKPTYTWALLEKGDLEAFKEFERKNSGMTDKEISDAISNDDKMWSISQRMKKCAAAIEKVPYTKEEKEDLLKPMADLIEKYKKLQLGPEWMLLISLFFIMLPRVEPFMPDIRKWFSSEETTG